MPAKQIKHLPAPRPHCLIMHLILLLRRLLLLLLFMVFSVPVISADETQSVIYEKDRTPEGTTLPRPCPTSVSRTRKPPRTTLSQATRPATKYHQHGQSQMRRRTRLEASTPLEARRAKSAANDNSTLQRCIILRRVVRDAPSPCSPDKRSWMGTSPPRKCSHAWVAGSAHVKPTGSDTIKHDGRRIGCPPTARHRSL